MQLGEKISLMRTLKGLTQEDMAAKLNMSLTGYAKIERGETRLQNPRLEKIAEVFGIELKELLTFDEKIVFNTGSFRDRSIQFQYHVNSAIELTTELEILKTKLEAKDKEIILLNEQIQQLKDIIELMKK